MTKAPTLRSNGFYVILFFFAIFLLLPILIGCGGGGGGLFSGDKGVNAYGYSFSFLNSSSTPSLTNPDIKAIALPFSNGGTGYAGSANGLFSFNLLANPVVFSKAIDPGLSNQVINCLLLETSGDLLVGTDNGIFRRTVSTGSFSAIVGLEGKRVFALAEPSSGTIWAGLEDLASQTNSIARSKNGGAFSFWGAGNGLTASSVVSIFADADMVVACGIGDIGKAGAFRFSESGNKFTQLDTPLGSGATLFTRSGNTWYVGGPSGGLYVSSDSGTKWDTLIKDITPYAFVQEFSAQSTKTWVSSDKGLYL
ncbi:hypothetical protein HYY75_11235, partial [bacterium]|nr:hypothetical protein [bacterium]